jgi:hypothetical protein
LLVGAAWLVPACSSIDDTPSNGACSGVELIVATSDYNENGGAICGAPGSCARGTDLGSDPMLSLTNGRAFFLARDEDLLFEVDAACGQPTASLSLTSLAPIPADGIRRPANPHDVAAAPDGTLLVALYDTPKIAIFGPGEKKPTAIDISAYDDDGNPQADAVNIVLVGGAPKAFVTLERLDDNDKLRSKQKSQMLRIDVATRTIEAAIDLQGRNPFNPMSELAGGLFMAEPGNFDAADDELAGIERFDTATSTSRLVVRERDLGGSVAEVSVTAGCGAAIIAGPQVDVNPTWLVTFDPETGRITSGKENPVLGPTPGYDLQGLAWRGDTLYVGDRRRGAAGYPVHVLTRKEGCVLVDSARTVDLPYSPVALRPAQQLQSR